MNTLLVACGSFVGFLVAYHTYGRWLAKRVFNLDSDAVVPSHELRDDVDFVPTKKSVIFGHHFTSIAGTGPIVGPAIAVFWGWLPALLWVVIGSIFIGAVHDFGALVVSLRNRGETVGEVAGRLISPRARVLFLLILFFSLTIVLAIFGLVIASIFRIYPQSVLSVWLAMPVAIAVGVWVYRRNGNLLVPSLLALLLLYGAVYLGVKYPISLPVENPTVVWTIVLMVYCYIASVLPVWVLLQPRDFINSHQLMVALVLLVAGLGVASLSGEADLFASTPAIAEKLPADAPLIWPFLFITIACGACSGFHCLVSSGTSSKQVDNEQDAQYVAYGSMLLEGALAVIVILACCAGLGMGITTGGEGTAEVTTLSGREAWIARYNPDQSWSSFGLGNKVGAFVDGGSQLRIVAADFPRTCCSNYRCVGRLFRRHDTRYGHTFAAICHPGTRVVVSDQATHQQVRRDRTRRRPWISCCDDTIKAGSGSRYGWFDFVAAFRRHQSVTRRTCADGNGFLFVATQQTSVRHLLTDAVHAGRTGVGVAGANVPPDQRVLRARKVLAVFLRARNPSAASLDGDRRRTSVP